MGSPDVFADVVAELRRAGLRVTAPRLAMLLWLDDHPHAAVNDIRAGVLEQLGSISTQAVYDVVAACSDAGLLRRIEPGGHPARFERRVGDNHHHVICRSCGRTEDVDCAVDSRPCLTPSDDHAYTLDEAEVIFWGHCPTCQQAAERRLSSERAPFEVSHNSDRGET